MKTRTYIGALGCALLLSLGAPVQGATVVAEFEIEGLVSPASPKALKAALEQKLAVKVLEIDVKNTPTGWPVLRVEFESGAVSEAQIEKLINATEDPTGENYKVHKGPPYVVKDLLEEEQKAVAALGPEAPEIPQMSSPVPATPESIGRGKGTYVKSCAKCHGLNGNGHGPSAHGFVTWPRELWVWNSAKDSADGYLYWMVTNGRTDMPPWGIVLSENERWDVINYIKTLKAPGQ